VRVKPGETVAHFRERNSRLGMLNELVWRQWLVRQSAQSASEMTDPSWMDVKPATPTVEEVISNTKPQ
jgi:hypothetical protein